MTLTDDEGFDAEICLMYGNPADCKVYAAERAIARHFYALGLAAIPREPTFEALRAAICSDYTDEQLQHGLARLANLRENLGERARAETICGVVYDGMIYPIRQSLGWTNKDDAA